MRQTAMAVVWAAAVVAVGGFAGCGPKKPDPTPAARYETLAPRDVPAVLRGTIFERTDVQSTEPLPVSSFGLVVGLPGTGDTTAPTRVREYMLREMTKRRFGSPTEPGFETMTPERVLDDPGKRVAIVRVDGYMPPGVRKGQTFDVVVSALPESNVTNLAGGILYRTELKILGADPVNPEGKVSTQAYTQGALFVNPSLALNPRASAADRGSSRASRRQAFVLDGGVSQTDQPLVLRLRTPQRSLARVIEARIRDRFADATVASAKDEGRVHLFVPVSFKGDYERFVGICQHLYLNGSPEYLSVKAKQLGEEALKPDAPLSNISYAWEAIGPVALPAVTPLMASTYPQDVQFAAARAAAFIGDPSAPTALVRIASTPGHQFQVEAVKVLGTIPQTPSIASLLRTLLDSDSTLVRVEAYRVLAASNNPVLFTAIVPRKGTDERFVLDVVPSKGPPVIYASRTGIPRLAVIGSGAEVEMPVTFTALDDRLSISSTPGFEGLTVFYRGESLAVPAKIRSRAEVIELIGWLGGKGSGPGERTDLSYAEVVAVVQAMADGRKLSARMADGRRVPVSFVLQDAPAVAGEIDSAPAIMPRTRPQGDGGAPEIVPATRPGGPAGVDGPRALRR